MSCKGVILAGGRGTRMFPMTKVVNKHLLPVGGKPMIQHCVEKLVEAGVPDIMVVTGGEHLGAIAEFLGGGKKFGCDITYRVQEEAGGIAQALALAEGFVSLRDYMCVILGDNMFEDSLCRAFGDFETNDARGAMVMLKDVPDPQRFGVAEVRDGQVVSIEEKPEEPKSNKAVTGVYFYDSDVFDIIRQQRPSDRGEMEITDVNNEYIRQGKMRCSFWRGWWTDAGTLKSYKLANELAYGD